MLSTFLFCFFFIFNFIEPDYILCNELVVYNFETFNNSFNIQYPKSCDQDFYHQGFTKFLNIFLEDYNYQARPLFILSVNLVFQFFDNFNINQTLNALISTFLIQNLISLIVVSLISLSRNENTKLSTTNQIILTSIIVFSPLFKWGIFDPSHQLLTVVVIIFYPYLISKNISINVKSSIYIGLLFLLHRSFLIGFLWYLFFSDHKNIFINLRDKIFKFLASLVPYFVYNFGIYIFLGQMPYDANSTYWGQFVWLYDFIRGKIRYESEWHCVTVPQNFICYFNDNIETLIYLSIPLFILLVNHFLGKNKISFQYKSFTYYLMSLSIFIYVFWSFIGWYPPIRFSYYSVGNLIIILFALQFIELKNFTIRFLSLTSYLTYTLFLNHWNDPNVLAYNVGIYVSLFFLIILFLYSISRYKQLKN